MELKHHFFPILNILLINLLQFLKSSNVNPSFTFLGFKLEGGGSGGILFIISPLNFYAYL